MTSRCALEKDISTLTQSTRNIYPESHLSRTRADSSWSIDVGHICKNYPTKFRPAATKGAIKARVAIRKWRDTYHSDTRTCQRNRPRASSCKPPHKIPLFILRIFQIASDLFTQIDTTAPVSKDIHVFSLHVRVLGEG
jgi:hypothetical protein